MKCNKCGADLQEGMNVCPNCNEPVVQTVENNTPVQEVQVPDVVHDTQYSVALEQLAQY